MKNCAVVGVNWGDEGKGRMVDLLTEEFQLSFKSVFITVHRDFCWIFSSKASSTHISTFRSNLHQMFNT